MTRGNLMAHASVPLAFRTTCGENIGDMVCRILEDLAKRWGREYPVTFSAAEEAGLVARATRPIGRELSVTLQGAACCRVGPGRA